MPDHLTPLRDGDDERARLLRDALGSAVPRARLSSEGIVGSGMSWTFAQASRLTASSTMIAPSIFASSYRSCGRRRVEADAARVEERSLRVSETISALSRERITSSTAGATRFRARPSRSRRATPVRAAGRLRRRAVKPRSPSGARALAAVSFGVFVIESARIACERLDPRRPECAMAGLLPGRRRPDEAELRAFLEPPVGLRGRA